MRECTEERFLKDVAKHEMLVFQDDGVHRHLRFKQHGTGCMHFDLITWPGYLCYTGDMGTYVFRRLEDMFEFFRTDREHMHLHDGKKLAINLAYWSEKLEADDRHAGYHEWNQAKFESLIREAFAEWIDGCDLEPEQKEEATARMEDEVLGSLDCSGKEGAYSAAMAFQIDGHGFPFQDWWEVDSDDYTFHFIWCCYALAWGIQKYDEAKM